MSQRQPQAAERAHGAVTTGTTKDINHNSVCVVAVVTVVSVVTAVGTFSATVAVADYCISVSIGTGVKHRMKITSASAATT